MLLQSKTVRIVTNHDNWLLQIMTIVITIYDRYYNSRQLLLQFTAGITIFDVITIHDSTAVCNVFFVPFPFEL